MCLVQILQFQYQGPSQKPPRFDNGLTLCPLGKKRLPTHPCYANRIFFPGRFVVLCGTEVNVFTFDRTPSGGISSKTVGEMFKNKQNPLNQKLDKQHWNSQLKPFLPVCTFITHPCWSWKLQMLQEAQITCKWFGKQKELVAPPSQDKAVHCRHTQEAFHAAVHSTTP